MEADPRHVSDIDVRLLIELASTPFDVPSFRRTWERHGAVAERHGSDTFGFPVPLSKSVLWVDPLGGNVISARLPTWYLDDSERVSSWPSDRASFDVAFEHIARHIHSILGPPKIKWRDEDGLAYQAWVWEGAHGVLVAQQAAIDTEFGDEVCLTVEGLRLGELRPTMPFVAGFIARSARLHQVGGFPPVP